MPGYLGVESVRGDDGFGITVSYWSTEEAIRNCSKTPNTWKLNPSAESAGTRVSSYGLSRRAGVRVSQAHLKLWTSQLAP